MNRIKDYKELQDSIVSWIKDYAESNGIKSLVVGVSGGIDSAVVSTLCCLTGLPTHCCSLDVDSSTEHLAIADIQMDWLDNTYENFFPEYMDLNSAYNCMIIETDEGNKLACANTKSRLRMVALYHIATHNNGIVVGTGNKVEDFGIGFFTKHGDGGVDISPIADLYKTEVRELGRYMGISEEILNSVPTDGLWADGRTDEDQIGCTYEELEWVMEETHNIIKACKPMTERQLEVVNIYRKLHQQNKHKFLSIPVYRLPYE